MGQGQQVETRRGPAAAPAGRTGLRRRVFAAGLGLLAGLLVVEMLARLRFGVPLSERTPLLEIEAHPTRGFAMVPDREHYTYMHRTSTNSLGLRGPELAAKAEGTTRWLLLGDSLVYGQGVADEHTLGALLEEEARRRGSPIEAVNGGLRAYATHQEVALLEELGDRIKPDVVVLCWYWNDISERDVATTFARLKASGPVPFDTAAPLVGRVWWRWQALQVLRSSALLMEGYDRWKLRRATPPDPDHVDAAFERLSVYLDRARAWCEARGVAFHFAVLPEAALVARSDHPAAMLQRRAVELAASKGISVFDLTPDLIAATERLGRLPVLAYDGHYDEAGNRVLAEALAARLFEGSVTDGR